MRRKWLAIGIILLFIGVAVTPGINVAVKASADTDSVEVTAQACGISGFGNTTVRLTKDQYQSLEQYLVVFRARLNQTTTREEAAPIFKEAVVELNRYGMLPKGMSIEQAQRLVTGCLVDSRLLGTLPHRNPVLINEVNNQFCLVAGNANENFIFGPIKSSLFILLMIITYLDYDIATMIDNVGFHRLATIFYAIDTVLGWLWMPVRVIPFEIGGLVTFGSYYYEWEVGPHYYPSNGWMYTLGLQGKQSINGSFYGNLRTGLLGLFFGMSGFTGIVIHPVLHSSRTMFLGSALRASFSTTPPYTK